MLNFPMEFKKFLLPVCDLNLRKVCIRLIDIFQITRSVFISYHYRHSIFVKTSLSSKYAPLFGDDFLTTSTLFYVPYFFVHVSDNITRDVQITIF